MAELTDQHSTTSPLHFARTSRASRPTWSAAQVGRVIEVGDGIALVSGLPDCAVNEMLEFSDGTIGPALNLDEESIGAVVLGDVGSIEEGQVRGHRQHPVGSRRRWDARPRRRCARQADRRQGAAHQRRADPPRWRSRRPASSSPAGERAAADRHQGHRQHDPDRPRPARADHRRPQDRQNRHRDRHDHQPKRQRREMLLRRDRSEGIDRRAFVEMLEPHGAMEYTTSSSRRPPTPPRCNTSPPTPAARWPSTSWGRRARPGRVRRSFQAGRARTASFRCCCAARRAAKLFPATCSICTAACSNAPSSSATKTAADRSPPCRSSKRRKATSRPTSRPT